MATDRAVTKLKVLVGRGDKIALFTLPFLLVGLILNIAYPREHVRRRLRSGGSALRSLLLEV